MGKTTDVYSFNWHNLARRLIKCIEYFALDECLLTWPCFASSEHSWACQSPFSHPYRQKNAFHCMPQWSLSSEVSIRFHASDMSMLEHAAMLRKYFILMLTFMHSKKTLWFFELCQFLLKFLRHSSQNKGILIFSPAVHTILGIKLGSTKLWRG